MSDLYDSLEDEGDDESCHSSDKLKTDFINPLNEGIVECESISDGHEPFFLDQKEKTGGREIESPHVQATIITNLVSKKDRTKGFLPKVDEVKKIGSNSASYNLAIDNEDLIKKGLQFNKDGSFTKSPRSETEQLPFVNPEYKNVQFQKSKTGLRGKSCFSKKNRKNTFTFKENSKDEISMIGIIKLREVKGSSEEILTSEGSLLSLKNIALKSGENFDNDNLTDSMKEMIMQKQHESTTARANKSSEQHKKPRPGLSLSGNSKNPKSKTHSSNRETLPHVSGDKQNDCEYSEKRKLMSNGWKKKLPQVDKGALKNVNPVVKKRSDILLNFSKPRLSYLERRQRESGFNPLYLRYGVKRAPSDTNRSNFGDSVADRLSELSSRVVSSRAITDDEDEELFYRRLIENEKSKQQLEMNRTSRSDAHEEKEKCVPLCSSNSCKNQKELKGSLKFHSRQKLKKSTSIDMPPTTTANSPMNSSHYCSINVSSSLSKTELALKARAYGYMANARNIFKMKTQSGGKSIQSESEMSGKRNWKKVINNATTATRPNENSEETERGFGVTSKRLLRASKSLQTEKYESVAHKEIVLPPVCVLETKDVQHKAEVLKRIRCCLNGATSESTYCC